MNEHYFYIAETTSTNVLMKEMLQSEALPNGFVVHAGFQSAGRGQGSNWESAKDKNLLFSCCCVLNKLMLLSFWYLRWFL